MSESANPLFPSLEPYRHGLLAVDALHHIYWEECGNPQGTPVVFLHGGPGAGCSVEHRRFFDPQFYRIILFDQRGAGRSLPFAELKDNSPAHLIADMEKLRTFLDIEQWLVFGGSWGSTLAIAYGEAHPERCRGFILRGVFMMRPEEIHWFIYGVRHFLPETWERLVNYLPEAEHGDILQAYYRRLIDPNPEVHVPAAKMFSRTEAEMSSLLPNPKLVHDFEEFHIALGLARMEMHYMLHYQESLGKQLFADLGRITHLPAIIVQGRYDLACPPVTAYEVAKAWPKAILEIIPDAGHSASEPGLRRALVAATEQFKLILADNR